MTSRIPPSRRDPEFAPQRAAKALSGLVPGAGRVAGVARPGVSAAVAAAIRGKPAPGAGNGLVIISPTEPVNPAVGQLWDDTGTSCGAGTPVTHSEAFTGTGNYPTGPIVTDGITWTCSGSTNHGLSGSGNLIFDGHNFDLTNSATRVLLDTAGSDGSMVLTGMLQGSGTYWTSAVWRGSSTPSTTLHDNYWILLQNGDVHKVVGNTLDATVFLACGAIPNNATVEIVCTGDVHEVIVNSVSAGTFTDSFNNTATEWGAGSEQGGGFGQIASADFSTAPPAPGHPLKMWDGTDWWLVSCIVPV